eukprot:scaffold163321_cov21-Tisochrysis_lutea.AAC.2
MLDSLLASERLPPEYAGRMQQVGWDECSSQTFQPMATTCCSPCMQADCSRCCATTAARQASRGSTGPTTPAPTAAPTIPGCCELTHLWSHGHAVYVSVCNCTCPRTFPCPLLSCSAVAAWAGKLESWAVRGVVCELPVL